jgi:hypothetical protein
MPAREVMTVRNWFRAQPAGVTDPVRSTTPAEAYRDGRVDERRKVERVGEAGPDRAAIDAAYQRGRERERMARRGSPLVALLVLLAVAVAGILIYLAIQNGSFSNGGAVIDRDIDKAEHRIDAPLKNAAESTGAALQKAGQSLK